jgi:hypothetical protein
MVSACLAALCLEMRSGPRISLVRFSAYVGNTTARLGIRIHEGVPGQVPECGEPRTIQIAICRLTKSQTLRRFVRCSHAASQPTCLTGPAESASGKSSPERFAIQASRNGTRHRVALKSGEFRLRRACSRMVQSPSLSSEDTPLMSCSSVYGFGRKAFVTAAPPPEWRIQRGRQPRRPTRASSMWAGTHPGARAPAPVRSPASSSFAKARSMSA